MSYHSNLKTLEGVFGFVDKGLSLDEVFELLGGGSVINGAYPVYFSETHAFFFIGIFWSAQT